MKIHTTNYFDAFIAVADDCPLHSGVVPPVKGDKQTIANLEFELISKHPYRYTSDDILFEVYARRQGLMPEERHKAREAFFSKGQPCLRTSPLTKRYGWGIHSDESGRVALYGMETAEYAAFADSKKVTVIKAMRSGRG